nr:LacI family DNA-binding transcriptional regulator [Candidatus Solirubrobacter pratensis]
MNAVAERAGVSKSLVSLVMRGAPNVSEARRAAVLQAAAELGYRPNLVARSLVERRTRTLGVLVSDLHNPFFAEVIDGLQAEAQERGLRIVLGTGRRDPAEEAETVEAFLQQDVDGLVLLSPRLPGIEDVAAAVPTVVVATRAEHVDVVVNDDALGAELAVAHLAELGHERIAHIAAAGTQERRAGYESAIARHGLEALIADGDVTDEGGYRGAQRLLANGRPTAIFACNDLAALGALTAIEEAGLSVPGDVSLVGYDNTYLASIRHIALTSVDQPRHRMGRLAVEALDARREAPGAPPALHTVTPHLEIRSSSASHAPRAARASRAP